jgi:hypothetical protein
MPQVDWSQVFASMRQQQPQQSRQQQQLQQQPQPLLPGGRLPPIQSARQPDPELQKRLLETLDKPPLPPLKPKPSLNGGRRRSKKSDTKKYKTRSKSRSRISTKRKNKNRRQTRK